MFFFPSFIIGIPINCLMIVSLVLLTYSLICIYRCWNKEKNKDLFNAVFLSGSLVIIAGVLNLIFRGVISIIRDWNIISVSDISPIILVFIMLVVIYSIAKSNGEEIYPEGYFQKLSDSAFLKSELKSAFSAIMDEFENIRADIFKRKENSEMINNLYNTSENSNFSNDFQDPSFFRGRLKDDRSFAAFILFNLITCGLYSLYFIYEVAKSTNIACFGDGDNTAGLLKYVVFSVITCGIYSFFWYYNLGNRIARNGNRYNVYIQESGDTLLLWLLIGMLVCGIGYWVAIYIIIKNLNLLCRAYNERQAS